MLSSKSVTAPALNLKPSRILAAYTILGHLIALAVLFYPMDIPVSIRLMIGVAVAVSFIYHWRSREPVVALRAPIKDDLWFLQLKAGEEVDARLYGEYTVTPWLIVLRFKTVDKRKFTVVVLVDSGGEDEIRRLRVFLRQLKVEG